MLSSSVNQSEPLVDAPVGLIEGVSQQNLNVFKGIPYAEAPVNELRWRPPVPKKPWNSIRKATEFGPSCVQPSNKIENIYTADIRPTSEDCLSLNIWAPKNANKAAIFVWIHGGALVKGSSKEPMYDGANLANTGIVVVSINYRLGVLGFLAHPELSAESTNGISGNYGLLDQIEALRWIKQNIESFGGDPNNITVAGESAGALSAMYLMASPLARGLFNKVITQSAYMISAPTLKESRFGEFPAETVGEYIGKKVDAINLDELRQLDPQTLVEKAAASGYFPQPTIDGHVVPRQLVETFERGEQAPVPILAGFNSGEIRSLTVLAPKAPLSSKEYIDIIEERYGDLSSTFLELYPAIDLQESIYATTRDALYGWTAERLARMQTAIGQPAYLYLFDHPYEATEKYNLHAFHASEIPYIFGNFDRTPKLWPKNPHTKEEFQFSKAMMDYWSHFAKANIPSADGYDVWKEYGEERMYMSFEEQPILSKGVFPGMFELHEESVCRRRATNQMQWNWNVGIISPVLTDDDMCQ
ncbi:carboxylesterase family protein [Alteromonadaceae bacterium BrNp21-10]|nr:carboxylesterase family protein [Alteromonadaceae bacterium BrNp21-10]